MNQQNAKHFLPLVQALAEGKTIQFNSMADGWVDNTDVLFIGSPDCYRIKPVFNPPAALFFVEYDWLLQGTVSPTPFRDRIAAEGWLECVQVERGRVLRFTLDDSYTPPTDPVEGWVGVYESGAGTIHQHKYQPMESRTRTRVAKIREVLPRVLYLHHDTETGKEIVTADLEVPRRDTVIVHQYVEVLT